MSALPAELDVITSPGGAGPSVKIFPHSATNTVVAVAYWPGSNACVVVDPCVDFDAATGAFSFEHADFVMDWVSARNLAVRYVLDTHIHADHLTGTSYMRARLHERARLPGVAAASDFADLLGRFGVGGADSDAAFERDAPRAATGALFTQVQETMAAKLSVPDVSPDGRGYDVLLSDGDTLRIDAAQDSAGAAHEISVIHTPGHTPSCVSFVCGDVVFVGDTLFAPDTGSARCDFPRGSAADLWRSVRRLLSLPGETVLISGHDYPGEKGRAFQPVYTVAEQRAKNVMVKDGVTETEYVTKREARDATLKPPRLLKPSIRWNIRGGAPGTDGAECSAKCPQERLSEGACFVPPTFV